MLTDLLCFIKLLKKPEVRIPGLWHLTAQYRVLNVTLALPSQVFYLYDFLVGRSQYPHIPFLFSIILTLRNSTFKSITEVYLFQGRNFFWTMGVSWVVISLEDSHWDQIVTEVGNKVHFHSTDPLCTFKENPGRQNSLQGFHWTKWSRTETLDQCITAGLQLCFLSLQQVHYPMWSLKQQKT